MNTFVEVPQPDSPHKSLPNLVDSALAWRAQFTRRCILRLSRGDLHERRWPKTLWRSRRRSPAEAMHDRTHERGTLIGRKDRDRVDVQADEDEEFSRRQCTLVLRQDVSGRRRRARAIRRPNSFVRLHAQKRQRDLC